MEAVLRVLIGWEMCLSLGSIILFDILYMKIIDILNSELIRIDRSKKLLMSGQHRNQ